MTQSPALIIATHEFAPKHGGAGTYALELGAALRRAGVNATIWAPDYGGAASIEEVGCPVTRFRAGGTLGFVDIFRLSCEWSQRRAQWENATVILASVGAQMACMLMGRQDCRFIPVFHGSEVLRFERNPLWRFLSKRFYWRVEKAAVVSEFSRSLIERSYLGPFLTSKLFVARCACTTAAAKNIAAQSPNDGKIRVLTLARIHPRKGQLDTARALCRLPEKLRARVIYQVAGGGDTNYLTQIRAACADGGVAMEYLGEVDSARLPLVYAGCDIFAMSSRTLRRSVEGFGIAHLDAGFHGKPVVGYRAGGVEEAVIDGETGFLVGEGNVPALSAALERLINEDALRARLGEAGRKRAAQFSWDATAARFLSQS